MAQIRLEGVSKSYDGGKTRAVDNLDLEIGSGEFITLLGPSGCGKTTTLNLLAGFLQPDAGRIYVGDRLVSSAESSLPPERRRMGMVFQSYALWPHKTVLQNVAYGLLRMKVRRREAAERARTMLETVGLDGMGDRHPGQLSGGQQQRVALARSLVTNPEILLLDEPLSNLDAKLRDRMRYEIQTIQERTGTTFVYVTHDQIEAMAMSDRVAIMEHGHLRQYAPPREIYMTPSTPYVADFMGLINMVPGTVRAVAEERVDVDIDLGMALTVPRTNLRDDLGEGSRVAVGVRPETIAIAAADGEGPGTGAVTFKTLLGNITHYYVEVSDTTVRVQAPFDFDAPVGSSVQLQIDPRFANVYSFAQAEPYLIGRTIEDALTREDI